MTGAVCVLGLLPGGNALAQDLPPLPEGEGISASYPNDVGIDDDPAVVFTEDFEGYTSGSVSWDEIGEWDNVYGDLVITVEPANVNSGSQAIEITHTSPQTHGAVAELPGYDTLFMRYYMKFYELFPGCHHTGVYIRGGQEGALFDNPTGTQPTGADHFLVSFDHLSPLHDWNPAENDASPGWAYIYCYHMDQEGGYGDVFLSTGMLNGSPLFGDEFVPRPNVAPELDRWYSFEVMVQVNTPGERDGRAAMWLDGVLVGDFPNLRFRTVESLTARYATLSTYSSRVDPDKTLWYDDIVVATEYIGPISDGGGDGDSDGDGDGDGDGDSDGDGDGDGDADGDGDGGADEGCGCRVASSDAGLPVSLALVVLGLLVLRRRC